MFRVTSPESDSRLLSVSLYVGVGLLIGALGIGVDGVKDASKGRYEIVGVPSFDEETNIASVNISNGGREENLLLFCTGRSLISQNTDRYFTDSTPDLQSCEDGIFTAKDWENNQDEITRVVIAKI